MEFVINYWAVIGAAAANMVVGMLWYGPVFGKVWRNLMGFTPESMKAMPLTPLQATFGGVITALLMSYVLAYVAIAFDGTTLSDALMMAFFMWLGFIAPVMAHTFLWEGRSFKLFAFNAAAGLVSMVAMSLVLVLWPW